MLGRETLPRIATASARFSRARFPSVGAGQALAEEARGLPLLGSYSERAMKCASARTSSSLRPSSTSVMVVSALRLPSRYSTIDW